MKKYLLIMLALLVATFAFADITIGTGTTSQRFPFGHLWGYERSAALYQAAEIGGTGTITHLKWNVQTVGTVNVPIKIYFISTTQTTFTAATWSSLTTGLTPVYEGTRLFNTLGWTTFDITDFNYGGGSLLVLVETNYGGGGTSGSPSLYYSTATSMHQQWTADNNPPTGNGTVNANRPNITLVGISLSTPPVATTLVSPANNATGVLETATLNWNTVSGADAYKLYFGTNNPPTNLVNGSNLGNVASYDPPGNMQYNQTYYWQVVPTNAYGDAAGCLVWSFTTRNDPVVYSLPYYEGFETGNTHSTFIKGWDQAAVAGTDVWTANNTFTDYNRTPRTGSWNAFLRYGNTRWMFKPILLQGGTAYRVSVYARQDGATAANASIGISYGNAPTAAGMTNTILAPTGIINGNYQKLEGVFSPATTEVYYVGILGTINSTPWYISIDDITIEEMPVNPMLTYSPSTVNLGTLMPGIASAPQNVTISNSGGGTLNLAASDISIIGTNAADFSFSTANLPAALGAGQSVNIPISAQSTVDGPIFATLRIVYDSHNYDVPLTAFVMPAGTVIIGSGTATARYPLGAHFGYERSAALYTAAEIGGGNKRISALAWYATENMAANVPTKIYLKTYGGNTLTTATWADMITGATVVYNLGLQGIVANDWNRITLTNTFDLGNGENLLVLVERNYGGGGAGTGLTAPAIRSTTSTNMHLVYTADTNPPTTTGSMQTTRPNLLFLASSYEVSNPPNPAVLTSPANGATALALNTTLNWSSGGGAPTGYKLYFGTGNPPAFVADLGAVTSYSPTLAYNTQYYWQVVPYNASGEATGCPVWSFSTRLDPTRPLPYIEDFNSSTSLAAINWAGDMLISATHGANSTNGLYRNMWSSVTTTYATSCPIGPMVADAELKFDYRIVNYSSYPSNATSLGATDNIQVMISTDGGTSFSTIHTINQSNHVSSAAFANKTVSLSAYNTGIIMVKFLATWGAGDYYVDIDNVTVRQTPANPVFGYSPTNINFGTVMHGVQTGPQNVIISNTGGGSIYISDPNVSIAGANSTEFSYSSANFPAILGAGQTATIPVYVTANSEGPLSATLRIYFNGDLYDVALSATALPAGIAIVGNGTVGQRQPFGHYYGYERSAAIYTGSQIGTSGYVDQLGWYVTQTTATAVPYKIYAGSTSLTSFTAVTWDALVAGLTLVKQGSYAFDSTGWHNFSLDAGFNYANDNNLIIAIETNYGGGGISPYAMFAYTVGGANVHQYWNTDNAPPTSSGSMNTQYPNLMIHFGTIPAGAPASPSLSYPENGATNLSVTAFNLTWSPDMVNGGTPDYYAVYLSHDEEDLFNDYYFETTNTHFDPINDGGINFVYEERWYWIVQAINSDGDALSETRWFQTKADPTITSLPWGENFDTTALGAMPEEWTVIASHTGADDRGWKAAYNVGANSAPNAAVVYYHASYDKNEWMITPPVRMTAGQLYFISFALKAPGWDADPEALALHWGMSPGVVAMNAHPALYSNANITQSSWTTIQVPFTPAANGDYYFGWHAFSDANVDYIAVDDISITVASGIDLTVSGISLPSVAYVNSPVTVNIDVANVGTGAVNSYQIQLKNDADHSVLAQLNVTDAINSGQTVNHQLIWTPAVSGSYVVYAQVLAAGDGNAANDKSGLASANVYAETMNILSIGNNATTWVTTAFPFNYYFEDFVAETIYLASEIQATAGSIEGLAYISNFDIAESQNFQIWMKNTNVNNLSAGWLSWDGYTLVYDGPVGSPAGAYLINIPITPFAYTGGNLAIRTSRTWTGNWVANKRWYITEDLNYPNRSRIYQNDIDDLDHSNPPAGTVNNYIPNIMIYLDSDTMIANTPAPVITATTVGNQVKVEWPAVPYAHSYKVYASEDYASFGSTPAATVYTNSYSYTPAAGERVSFFKVTSATYRDIVRGILNSSVHQSQNVREAQMPGFKKPRIRKTN